MAYQNRISITIEANDKASAVLAATAAQAKEQQAALAAAAKESAAKQSQATTTAAADINAAQADIAASAKKTAASTTVSMDEARASVKAYGAAVDETAAQTEVASAKMRAAMDKTGASSAAGGISNKLGLLATATAGAVAVATGVMVHAAGDFQAAITRLATSAGESESNLKMVGDGVLLVARDTGTSTKQLTAAMYTIESGGQHAADALAVLKAAAQGAKTENADLATVADAVTSALTDYHLSASSAADVTSKLVAATGQGKTTFQELAGAMPAILPVASAAHIALSDILGDLASMTIHGISAQQAAENMADAVRHLQAPTQTMSKELAALGINSTRLSQNLGSKGLSGTIQEISQAIMTRMGPQTTGVILNMQDALKGLPKSVQDVSQQVINGTATWGEWNKATKTLNVTQRAQAQSFATLYNGMHTIGTEQMTGAQVMQTYAGAMNKAMGDSAGLNVALMLTGENTQNTTNAIKAVAGATADASGNVKGWSDIQHTFNQQMSVFKEGISTTGIALGTALLPPITAMVHAVDATLKPIDNFISSHKDLAAAILLTTGGLAAFVALSWGVQKAAGVTKEAFTPLIDIVKKLAVNMGLLDAAEGTRGLSGVAKELSAINSIGSGSKIGSIASELASVGKASTNATPELTNLLTKLTVLSGGIGGAGGLTAGFNGLVATLMGPVGIALGVTAIGAGGAYLAYKHYSSQAKEAQANVVGLSSAQVQAANSANNVGAAQQYVASSQQAVNRYRQQYIDASAQVVTFQSQEASANKRVSDAMDGVRKAYDKYGANSPQYVAAVNSLTSAEQNQKTVEDNLTKAKQDQKKADDNLQAAEAQLKQAQTDQSVASDKVYQASQKLQAAKQNESNLTQIVTKDQKNLNDAIQMYGANSDGARDAAKKLADDMPKLSKAQQDVQYWASQASSALKDEAGAVYAAIQAADKASWGTSTGQGSSKMYNVGNAKSGPVYVPAFAGGTDSAPGGMALVGENGPELVNLPSGSQVFTADETRHMVTGSHGKNSPSVYIANLNVNNGIDVGLVTRQLGWQLANA